MVIMVYIRWVVHFNYGIYWVGSSWLITVYIGNYGIYRVGGSWKLWYILGGWFMVFMVYIGQLVHGSLWYISGGCSWVITVYIVWVFMGHYGLYRVGVHGSLWYISSG